MPTLALKVPAPLSGGGSCGDLGGVDRQRHAALGGARDLGGVDEAQLAASSVSITIPSRMCSR